MKKYLIILLAVLLTLVACASTDTDINARNEDGSPIWTTEVPQSKKYYYGVGSAKLTSEANSIKAAETNASANLARKVQATVEDATSYYTFDAEGLELQAYESITLQTVNVTLRGVKVEQNYKAPDGTIWVLVSLEAKKIGDMYELAANDYYNQVEEEKLKLDRQRINAIEDLNKKLDQLTQDATTLEEHQAEIDAIRADLDTVNAYADSERAKLDAALSSIAIDEVIAAINDEIIKQGYTE